VYVSTLVDIYFLGVVFFFFFFFFFFFLVVVLFLLGFLFCFIELDGNKDKGVNVNI